MIAMLFAAALDQIADGRAGCLVTVLARAGNKPSRSFTITENDKGKVTALRHYVNQPSHPS